LKHVKLLLLLLKYINIAQIRQGRKCAKMYPESRSD